MKKKFDYTKAESLENVITAAVFSALAAIAITAFTAWVHWPKKTYADGYDAGYYKAEDKFKSRYTEGWDDAKSQFERLAVSRGAAEYRLNKITGKIEFQWK